MNQKTILRSGFIPSVICVLTLLLVPPSPSPKDALSPSIPEMRVRIVDVVGLKRPVAGATVVLGRADGSIVASVKTGETGEVTFKDPPVDAIVTAAANYMDYADFHIMKQSVEAYFDVNVAALTIPIDVGRGPIIGKMNVDVASAIPDVAFCQIQYGGSRQEVLLKEGRASVTLDIYRSDLQNDGKLSFILWGMDAEYNLKGYGILADQIFKDGVTLQASLNLLDFRRYTFGMAHVPKKAKSFYSSILFEKKGIFNFSYRKNSSPLAVTPMPTSVQVQTIPNVGDSYCHLLEVYTESSWAGSGKSMLQMKKTQPAPSEQLFNFQQVSAVPTNLKVKGSGTSTPSFSWDGIQSSVDEVYIYFFTENEKTTYGLHFPPSRNTVAFPQLPDEIASFKPAKLPFDDFQLSVDRYDFIEGWRDYLTKTDRFVSGTFSLPPRYNRETSQTHP
jgi:hypothetical protein